MKHYLSLTMAAFMTACLGVPVFSSIHPDAGTRAGSFLLIGPSARASAMGGAFTAVPGEAASLDWNPSGISPVPGTQVSATYAAWFADTRYGNLGLAFPAGKTGAAGLSYTYLDYGDLTRVTGQDAYGVPIEAGTFGASDMNLALAYAGKLSLFRRDLLVGAAARALRLAIDGSTASGYAVDVGLSFLADRNTVLGIAGRNLGNLGAMDQVGEQLAQELAFGASRRFSFGYSTVLIAGDCVKPVDFDARFRAGIEYGYREQFFLRAGYRSNYDTDGPTAGAGLMFDEMRLDYAYAPFSVLGDTHRVTLNLFLGEAYARVRAPRQLMVSTAGETSLALSWDARGNRGGTRYEIIRSTDAFSKNIVVSIPLGAGVTGSPVTVEGLSPDTDYWFKVRAFGKDGGIPSTYSNTARVRTLPRSTPPEEPGAVAAAAVAPSVTQNTKSPLGAETRLVHFNTNRYDVRKEYRDILDSIAENLKNNPGYSLRVEGHCDATGSFAYNDKLSLKRAERARKYLISRGILPERVTCRGFGERKPVASNSIMEGRRMNRRVEFVLIAPDGTEIRPHK